MSDVFVINPRAAGNRIEDDAFESESVDTDATYKVFDITGSTLLENILVELKKMNLYLSLLTGEEITDKEILE